MRTFILFVTITICLMANNFSPTQAQGEPLPDTIWTVQFDNYTPYDAKFSPDGTIIAHSLDGNIHIRDAATGALIKQFEKKWHNGWPVQHIEFSPDGKFLFTGGGQGTDSDTPFIRMWDIETGDTVKTFTSVNDPNIKTAVLSMDVNIDGTKLIAIIFDKWKKTYLYEWDINSNEIIQKNEISGPGPIILKFSPDGKYLAISKDEQISLYDAETFSYIGKFSEKHKQNIMDIAFSPDGSKLASVGMDTYIKIHNVETRSLLKSFSNNSYVCRVGFNSTGKYIVSGGSGYDQTKIWDTENDSSLVYVYEDIAGGCQGLDVFWNNDYIICTGGRKLNLLNGKFDITSVQEIESNTKVLYPNPTNNSLIFSYNQPLSTYTTILVFNESGVEVDKIHNGYLDSGEQEFQYNCSHLSSGVYFIHIHSNDSFSDTIKFIKE